MESDWGDERREYFRIHDRLLLECRPVTYEESLILEKKFKQEFRFKNYRRPDLSELSDSPPLIKDLYIYLEVIEKKLDRVLEMLSKNEGTGEARYVDMDISAGGMNFSSDTKWDVESYLELRIVLPFLADAGILALGKIVRVEQAPGDANENWEISVSFIAMREEEKDLLINYIFSKERERLRAERTP